MKKTHCKSLNLLLMTGLFLGTTALSAYAETTETVTAPSGYIRAMNGVAKLVDPANKHTKVSEDGKTLYILNNTTTQKAIHGDEKDNKSLSTMSLIRAAAESSKKLNDLPNQTKDVKKPVTNANCATCDKSKADQLNEMVFQGSVCSNDEKKRIADERLGIVAGKKGKDSKLADKCSWGSNFDAITKYQLLSTSGPGLPGSMGVGIGTASCVGDILKQFGVSMKEMTKTFFQAATFGLFSGNKAAETAGKDKGAVLSSLTDEEIAKAKENAQQASYDKMNFFQKRLDNFAFYALQLGTEDYREILDCAKCTERANALCKVIGMIGKDVVRNFLIAEAAGTVLKGVFAKAAKTKAGGKVIKWGGEKVAAFTEKHSAAIIAYNNSAGGKILNAIGRGAMKVSAAQDDLNNGIKKIFIKGGNSAEKEVVMAAEHASALNKVPGENKGTRGLATLDNISEDGTPIKVGMPREPTPAMEKAEQHLAKTDVPRTKAQKFYKKGEKINTTGIYDAEPVKAEAVTAKTVAADTPWGRKYYRVDNPEAVDFVMPFEGKNKKSAMIFNKDGSVHIAQDNVIVARYSKKEAEKLSPLWKDDAAVDKELVFEARQRAGEAGEGEVNASHLDSKTGRWEMQIDCNGKKSMVWIEAAI